MSEDVEIIDLTSTSELLSRTEYSRKCIAEGDDETALKSLEKVIDVNPRSIPTLLERATIYVKQCDYDNACANLHEIFNIDSQNLPALSLLHKITKIQAQKFIDRKHYGAAAGFYLKLLKMPVLSQNKKLGSIFLELIVRHVLSFYTELSITDMNNMHIEQDDQRLHEGRDLAENDLRNVIEQRRLSRMSAVEVNTASSQVELDSDDTDVEEEWTTRKISNDRRRESNSRKIMSAVEVNTASSQVELDSDDTDVEEAWTTRKISNDWRRESNSRKIMSAVEVNTASSQVELDSDDTDVEEEWTTRKISNDRRRESNSRKMKSPIEVSTVSSRRHFVSDDTDEEEQQLARRRPKDQRRRSHSKKRSHPRRKRRHPYDTDEEWTAKGKSKRYRRESYSVEREATPGPSGIYRRESEEEWKVIRHHKSKHMHKESRSRKRRYKHCRCCRCERHRDFSDSHCHHCYDPSSSSDSSA